ncbi:MAG: chorismate synthase [Elusimicrobia bacterium]|nr:chorismate synthase [Elusimicrobiota bacterium]
MRYVTAGESHGKQLTVILEGIPAGLKLSTDDVNKELARRQEGYGRGARMKIEKDAVEFVGGVRLGETIGSPICMVIKNFDWENWQNLMASEYRKLDNKTHQVRPRPGHADLAAAIKYGRTDLRDILERASARETASRVAAGAVCKKFLQTFDIRIGSFVKVIGGVSADISLYSTGSEMVKHAEKSSLRTPDPVAEKKMIDAIAAAEEKGDTVGGVFTVVAQSVPVGLGSHTQWDQKLDARMAMSLMSIQAVKGVEFGLGFGFGYKNGSLVHDEIFFSKEKRFYRTTNNAGGFEGGITNGEEVLATCVMKPIPSLKRALKSVNLITKKADLAEAVRSDICAVPAAGVIGESAVAFELSRAMKEKFGGDSMDEIQRTVLSYRAYANTF